MMVNTMTSILLVLLIAVAVRAEPALPDPTRPADYSVTRVITQDPQDGRAEFSVNAIRISEQDRSAIVNGKVVRVGDRVSNAQVKEIAAARVVLDIERKLVTVPLYAGGVTKQYKSQAE